MRFIKTPRFVFEDTARKRAALDRKQARERDAFPLFAEQIAAEQAPPDVVMARRAEAWDQSERTFRNGKAKLWRQQRAIYFALPPEIRAEVATRWRAWRGPAQPGYLSYVVRETVRELSPPAADPAGGVAF